MDLIRACRFGIHDISRTELNSEGLPRFNMPLELGLFLGAQRFSSDHQTRKVCMVLDTEKYRYQKFISDIAGQDITSHEGSKEKAVSAVRNWLGNNGNRESVFPSGKNICLRFAEFNKDLPKLCIERNLDIDDLTYVDYTFLVSNWLTTRLAVPKRHSK